MGLRELKYWPRRGSAGPAPKSASASANGASSYSLTGDLVRSASAQGAEGGDCSGSCPISDSDPYPEGEIRSPVAPSLNLRTAPPLPQVPKFLRFRAGVNAVGRSCVGSWITAKRGDRQRCLWENVGQMAMQVPTLCALVLGLLCACGTRASDGQDVSTGSDGEGCGTGPAEPEVVEGGWCGEPGTTAEGELNSSQCEFSCGDDCLWHVESCWDDGGAGVGGVGSVSGPTSSEEDSGEVGDSAGELLCGEEWVPKPNPDASDLMARFGASCTSDDECSDIGVGAVCITEMLALFELPNGYCTRLCELPDPATTVATDDPACNPDGGVDCVGAKGIFSMCAPQCSEDSQCAREGYACQRIPNISGVGDPQFCLMNPDACCLDPGAC